MVADRRPSMGLYPEPWLSKPAAVQAVWKLVSSTALAELGLVGYLDAAGPGTASWLAPGAGTGLEQVGRHLAESPFDARESALDDAFAHLVDVRRSLPPGTFVFFCSDFLAAPEPAWWARALAYRWDVVPVILQDPVWERSFPAVAGVAVPVTDPIDHTTSLVRLQRRQAARLRDDHELRYDELVALFTSLGLEPVTISSSDPIDIDSAFGAWAEERRRTQWAR